jgi:hypothetical protein
MSDDGIQSERTFWRKQKSSAPAFSGRAWVKRDFDLWQRCTIEDCAGTTVAVVLDNMDELSVMADDVKQFDLQPHDLVFIQHWNDAAGGPVADGEAFSRRRSRVGPAADGVQPPLSLHRAGAGHAAAADPLGGYPGFVISAEGEMVDVVLPATLYRQVRDEIHTCFQRDLRIYDQIQPADWQRSDRVFAYKAVQFDPPLFLFFPAVVRAVHYDVVVEVEFEDGESALVPATLVEPFRVAVGDVVHTCVVHQAQADDRWGPCRVVSRDGDSFLLEDGVGAPFEAGIGMIAKLPRGYRMPAGKLEKSIVCSPPILG